MTAGSDPPSPDDPGALRPRSGPAEVPHALIVAARNGDPAAFARFVEHWDTHLRPFVHHTLAGDGSTDRVLSAAYIRAYRGLPRYRAAQSPGLWLHRIAYLAAVEELRRLTRDPRRRKVPTNPTIDPGLRQRAEPTRRAVAEALRRLAPDQRAIAVMVDLEGYRAAAVAGAFDTGSAIVANRLGSARRALADAADPLPSPAPGLRGRILPPPADLGPSPGLVAGRARAGDAPATDGGGPDVPAVAPVGDALGGVLVGANPVGGPALPDDDPFPVPAWAEEFVTGSAPGLAPPPSTDLRSNAHDRPAAGEGANAAVPDPRASDAAAETRLAALARSALADLPVPPPGDGFWTDLGRRLLSERERPAALTPDPVARLARAHPAELGFRPSAAPASVSMLADRADRNRPRRRWRRPLALVGAVLVVAGVVAGAVAVGISGKTPDGSVTGVELANTLARALDGSRYLNVDVLVEERAVTDPGEDEPQPFRLTLGDDGSWVVTRTDTFDQTTYDGTGGLLRRVVAVPASDGAPPVVLVGVDTGLAAGEPDPAAEPVELLGDLRSVGTLLRADGSRRAPATRVGGVATWTYRRTVATGEDGADEVWHVAIRRSDGLPMRIDRHRNGQLVRRIRFSGWEPASEVPGDTFQQPLPRFVPREVNAHGFAPVDLPGAAILGRGPAITPAWLPDGFELASVAVLAEAPTGTPTTGGGTNPPDVAVTSLGYQRGPERITVTTRGTTAPAGDWQDPFANGGAARNPPDRRTLGDGRFNQTPVSVGTDAVGRAQLWGIDDDTVFTVGGDLTADDAFRVASSLR